MLKKVLSVIGFIAMLIAALIGKGIGHIVGQSIGNSVSKPTTQQIENAVENGLAKSVESINKTLPMMIDKETRMDKAEVNSGLHANYFYTFLNYSSHDIEPRLIQINVKPDVKKNVCTNEQMKPSLQLGVTYGYIYRGNDGLEIGRFEINKNDCTQDTVNVQQFREPLDATKNDNTTVQPIPSTVTPISPIETSRQTPKKIVKNSQKQTSNTQFKISGDIDGDGTISGDEILGDSNGDGVLSGSEQYLRDHH